MEETLTGKQFKAQARGADIRLEDIAKEAKLAPATPSAWYNGSDIYKSSYDKLVGAFNKLKED